MKRPFLLPLLLSCCLLGLARPLPAAPFPPATLLPETGDTASITTQKLLYATAAGKFAPALIPAGTTNGTIIGTPVAPTVGVEIYVPPGASVTYTLAPAQPASAPTLVVVVSNPAGATSTLVWPVACTGGLLPYVTAVTGAPFFRFM